MRDDRTTNRFVIYNSLVAFDVITLPASDPKPARFSAFDLTTPLSRGPHLERFCKPGVQFHAFRQLKRGERKGFEKNLFMLKSAYYLESI